MAAMRRMLYDPDHETFLDSRVSRIYAGSTEIMKEIIGRSLHLAGAGPQ